MKATIKRELEAIIGTLVGMIGREYGLSDDSDPDVKIGGVTSSSAAGHFSMQRNELAFRPAMVWQGSIAHELAHWVQYHTEGNTDCLCSHATNDYELQNRHAKLESHVLELMACYGVAHEIDKVLG